MTDHFLLCQLGMLGRGDGGCSCEGLRGGQVGTEAPRSQISLSTRPFGSLSLCCRSFGSSCCSPLSVLSNEDKLQMSASVCLPRGVQLHLRGGQLDRLHSSDYLVMARLGR